MPVDLGKALAKANGVSSPEDLNFKKLEAADGFRIGQFVGACVQCIEEL